MQQFVEWLAQTSPSVALQTHEWAIPTIQSLHILAIGCVLASVLMIDLRVLGLAWRDETLTQTTARFGPWLSWGLLVLLLTGIGMIVGEPARELLALSFWLKMGLLVVGTALAVAFLRSLGRHEVEWETARARTGSVKALAVTTLVVWAAIVVLGRLIAYDYVWGAWSSALKGPS